MTSYRTGNGEPLAIGPRLGKGGEGEVRFLSGAPQLVVKIYTDGKAKERREKIEAMAAAGLHRKSESIAFPVDAVFAADGTFVGFTMKKFAGSKPIHELYAPGSRKLEFPKANFPFLVRAAINIARTVGQVHKLGCVIGDINHSGIMVRADATASLIDCDSFQFAAKGKLFRCRVGVGEYTPPELQGKRLETLDRTPNHDAFGLAVVMFQLLFMGRHPFAGRFKGRDDMPIERAISEGRFVYGARAAALHMEPPPGVPTLQDVPTEIAAAFESAFTLEQPNRSRPEVWVELLSRLEKNLVVCSNSASHHYYRLAPACPWCRFERESNTRLFPLSLVKSPALQVFGLDLGRIIAALEAVVPPPAADALQVVKKPEARKPTDQALRTRKHARWLLQSLATAAVAAALFAVLAVWWAFALLVVAMPFAAIGFGPRLALRAARKKARMDWSAAARAWQSERGPPRFEERRAALKRMAEDYRHLPAIEQRNLATLEEHKRDTQRKAFLQTFSLLAADLDKIGESRKAVLASYGIETANDITEQALKKVPGFSDLLVNNLLAWRKTCESRFLYDPARPVSRNSIRDVKDDMVRLRLDLEHVLRHGRSELETLAHSLAAAQKKSSPELDAAYAALKQAESDVSS